jgi:hypothetical protein
MSSERSRALNTTSFHIKFRATARVRLLGRSPLLVSRGAPSTMEQAPSVLMKFQSLVSPAQSDPAAMPESLTEASRVSSLEKSIAKLFLNCGISVPLGK